MHTSGGLCTKSAHSLAEQRRRDAIKKGFSELSKVVPACREMSDKGLRVTNKIVMEKSVACVQNLQEEKYQKEAKLHKLREEVLALEILRENSKNRNNETQNSDETLDDPEERPQVTEEAKFEVFKTFMDSLFSSFVDKVPMDSFSSVTKGSVAWLEDCCQPEDLNQLVKLCVHKSSEAAQNP